MQDRLELARDLIEQAKALGRELGLETYYASDALRQAGVSRNHGADDERAGGRARQQQPQAGSNGN